MKEKIIPVLFLIISVVALVIAITTSNETIKTLLGAPAFVGVILSASVLPFEFI